MTQTELQLIKSEIKQGLDSGRNTKEKYEENGIVKHYLQLCKMLEEETNYQKFLEKLEIGEDGTVFSFFNQYHDKAHKNTHFGLSRCLNHAFNCIEFYSNDKFSAFNEISLYQLLEYLENAEKILTDMNYWTGDRLVSNEYGLEIYLNPKNYSVIDRSLLPLTNEKLQLNYEARDIRIIDGNFIKPKSNDVKTGLLNGLTTREITAFYGEEAQRILGVLPKKEKVRTKKSN